MCMWRGYVFAAVPASVGAMWAGSMEDPKCCGPMALPLGFRACAHATRGSAEDVCLRLESRCATPHVPSCLYLHGSASPCSAGWVCTHIGAMQLDIKGLGRQGGTLLDWQRRVIVIVRKGSHLLGGGVSGRRYEQGQVLICSDCKCTFRF